MGALRLALLASATAGASAWSSAASERPGSGALRGGERSFSAQEAIGGQVPPIWAHGRATPIHVLISAFQDGQRCADTIGRALAKAEHPDRVSFSVLQALGPNDTNCLEEFAQRHLPELCAARGQQGCAAETLARVSFWTIPCHEGKGPVHQRGLLSERADLSGADAMCLSIDSHMDFLRAWDSELLQDWAATENEFAVLTAYPQATWDADTQGKRNWISLCGYFLEDGIPRGAQSVYRNDSASQGRRKPVLTMNWAAGQSFSRCHAERNVPADKHLRWVFDGEEVSRAVRLWTHGYDLYNPRVSVVLHNYSSASQAFWSFAPPIGSRDGRDDGEAASRRRLLALLRGQAAADELGRYGLGSQRSLEDFVMWSRTDLGGPWRAFLLERGLAPNLDGESAKGKEEPWSIPAFCEGLERAAVRNAKELVASIG